MNLPTSQAQRFLDDCKARGVSVTLGKDPVLENGVRRIELSVMLSGGRCLPGDFDKVKRFKPGIIAILGADTAGDFMQCVPTEHFAPELDRRIRTGVVGLPAKQPIQILPPELRIEPQFKPMKEGPKKAEAHIPNWAKPLLITEENQSPAKLWEIVENYVRHSEGNQARAIRAISALAYLKPREQHPTPTAPLSEQLAYWEQRMTDACRGIANTPSNESEKIQQWESDFHRASWNYRDATRLLLDQTRAELAAVERRAEQYKEWTEEMSAREITDETGLGFYYAGFLEEKLATISTRIFNDRDALTRIVHFKELLDELYELSKGYSWAGAANGPDWRTYHAAMNAQKQRADKAEDQLAVVQKERDELNGALVYALAITSIEDWIAAIYDQGGKDAERIKPLYDVLKRKNESFYPQGDEVSQEIQ